MTLLHQAAGSDNIRSVEALIKMGAKTSITTNITLKGGDMSNTTPIHMAIYRQRPEILACMLLSDDAEIAMTIKCGASFRENLERPLDSAIRIAIDRVDGTSFEVSIYLCYNVSRLFLCWYYQDIS